MKKFLILIFFLSHFLVTLKINLKSYILQIKKTFLNLQHSKSIVDAILNEHNANNLSTNKFLVTEILCKSWVDSSWIFSS